MIRTLHRAAQIIPLAAIVMAAGLVPAAAESPTLLGAFKEWAAYTQGKAGTKVCYVLSQPKTSLPRHVNRDPIFFLVSDWPARKTKGETEMVAGYPYKDDSKVTVRVGSDKFTFFTRNDGTDGSAWIQNLSEEPRLIAAMRRGSQMIVTGTSSRGTLTTDTFSLSGISAALDKIHASCGM